MVRRSNKDIQPDFIDESGKVQRICVKCGLAKELNNENFLFRNKLQIWRRNCKKCCREHAKEYYKNNTDKILQAARKYRENSIEKRREYREKNKAKCAAQKKIYHQNNKAKIAEQKKIYRDKNKIKSAEKHRKYNKENKDKIAVTHHKYYEENKDKISNYTKLRRQNFTPEQKADFKSKYRQYVKSHKDLIYKRTRNYIKKRMQNDPSFKLRMNLSKSIADALKERGGSKNGKSILKYLPFSMDELKQHLESQFEPWMNWNNRGTYKVDKWDDNDLSTWTWQIDHIIPHSLFKFTSMDDEEFKKCWALENLRPLNSKQNVIDGSRKTRHKGYYNG